jgi:peroxiredoxin
VQEFPVLDAVAKKFAGARLVVLTINSDHDEKDIQKVLDKVETSLPVLRDVEEQVFGAYRAVAVPTMYLIDGQGKIYSAWTGPVDDLESELTTNITSMLERANESLPTEPAEPAPSETTSPPTE